MFNSASRLVAFSLSLALLAGAACSSGGSNNGTGTAGTSGSGTAGTTGAGGTGNSTGGTTGSAGTGAGGTTGAAGSTTTGSAGISGSAGTTGAAGSTATGTAGTNGAAGRGGTMGSAGTTGAAGSAAGAGGTAGAAGTLGPGGAPPACQAPTAVGGNPGTVVDVSLTTTVRATVSPDLMGIHTSVYDNNMLLPTTPDLLKAAGVKSLRYPGGSYADLYHWKTHTGTHTPASGAGSNVIYINTDTYFGNFLLFMEKVGASALITVNYGMNSTENGPGEPKEAAAWVAYANGTTSSTVSIGADSKGTDWKTVAYWAGLRAATPMPTDDGMNKFRINHPAPFNIKYWEVGNELYGNGFYYGSCGWEADMHVPYPTTGDCTNRMGNSALSPSTYGTALKAFATAMKAVDSSIKIGGIVVGTSETEYANPSWNAMALAAGCSAMDFASLHWYAPANSPGITINNVSTVPELELPGTFNRVRTALGTAAYNCPGGVNMPIAITEWGPNTLNGSGITIPMSTADHAPTGSQSLGLFAAEAYAQMMDLGALAAHWLELHNNSYLAGVDATNDPFTTVNDTPRWGYHGAQIAHFLAGGGDKMVKATTGTAGLGTVIKSHASVHANGDVAVMLTNTNRNFDAAVTVNVTGGNLACVGTRYAYTTTNVDYDGGLTGDWIFANTAGTGFTVLVPKFSSVVVTFPKK